MKLRSYIDIYSGSTAYTQAGYMATTMPHRKMEGYKRFAFDVTIPDTALHDIDGFAPEVGRAELVRDTNEADDV